MLLCTLLLATLFNCVLSQIPCSQYSYPCADVFAFNWPIVAFALPDQNILERNVRTSYLVACPEGSMPQTCDFVQPMTMIVGPSTAAMNYTGLGGIGSVTISIDCVITPSIYAACAITGGIRVTSGPSSNVILQQPTPVTVFYTGSAAVASLFKNVASVYSTSSLLTYTPPGATVSAAATITTNYSPSTSTTYSSSSQTTDPPTSTPSSSRGASQRGTGQAGRNLGKAFGVGVGALFVQGVF